MRMHFKISWPGRRPRDGLALAVVLRPSPARAQSPAPEPPPAPPEPGACPPPPAPLAPPPSPPARRRARPDRGPAARARHACRRPCRARRRSRTRSAARRRSTGTAVGGYGELTLNAPSNAPAVVDLRRFVLFVGHNFTDRIRFYSEVEVEHAVSSAEDAGEVEIEQAYLDGLLSRRLNLRAGLILMPVGIINVYHEPPTFNGVDRPEVDTLIIPSTWREPGFGIFGELTTGVALPAVPRQRPQRERLHRRRRPSPTGTRKACWPPRATSAPSDG